MGAADDDVDAIPDGGDHNIYHHFSTSLQLIFRTHTLNTYSPKNRDLIGNKKTEQIYRPPITAQRYNVVTRLCTFL